MSIAFQDESQEYRAARDRLLESEIDLRRAMERVAVERRQLPPGPVLRQDYVFHGLDASEEPVEVRLSELFAPNKNSLMIYNMMFPRDATDLRPGPPEGVAAELPLTLGPCPSCTAIIDQLEGAAEHMLPRMNVAVVGKAPIDLLNSFARERGWNRLRMLSSSGTTFKRDYHAETDDGTQRPMLLVFHRDPQSETIRLFWSSEMLYGEADPGQDVRHVGTIEPLWNVFDLIPEGRGDWDEQLDYDSVT